MFPRFMQEGNLQSPMFYNTWENLLLNIDEIKDKMLENGDTLDYDMIHV